MIRAYTDAGTATDAGGAAHAHGCFALFPIVALQKDPDIGIGQVKDHLRTLFYTNAAADTLIIIDDRQAVATDLNGMERTGIGAGTKSQTAEITLTGTTKVFCYQMAVLDSVIIKEVWTGLFTAVTGQACNFAQT